jgi:hypothetical protein
MSKFEITSEDMTDIHNGLVYLRNAIDKLEDTLSPFIIVELRKSKSLIQKGFNGVQTQKDKQWDDRNDYYTEIKERCRFQSVWSMYEVEDIEEKAFDLEDGSVLVHENFSVPLPVGSVSWFQLWMAAEEAIYAVGGDHIFIESLTQSSINPKIILLGTGS